MYYRTRSQFSESDFEFIAQTLGKTSEERSALLRLADDPYTLQELLHEGRLFERSMTAPPAFLTISPHLFFYLFVYRALEHKGIADDDLVDYVAGFCVEFRSSESLWHLGTVSGGKTIYLVDLLGLLESIDGSLRYFLRLHIGNVALFLTGFYPDFIYQRSKRKGAPSIEYYESIGRMQYESAATQSRAYDEDAAPVLQTLADRFVDIRSAMNVCSDARLHLSSRKHSVEVIERQASTLDEDSFRRSIDS